MKVGRCNYAAWCQSEEFSRKLLDTTLSRVTGFVGGRQHSRVTIFARYARKQKYRDN